MKIIFYKFNKVIFSRDESVEALTDGLYVSPGVESADYHASLNKNSWFYVFDYQTKYGDFSQVGFFLKTIHKPSYEKS